MLSKKLVSRQKFFLVFFVLTLAIIFCYIHLDLALVNFFHNNKARQYNWLALCAEIPPLIAGIAVIVIYLLILIYFLLAKTKNIKHWIHIANICSISVFFKDIAKMLFSRYFPDTWFCNNLSYIKHGVYGFGGIFAKLINSSFPSGHVTLITAFVMAISYYNR